MPWNYRISTGQLRRPDGSEAAIGYAGRDEGLNNPAAEAIANTGPIPDGWWIIGTATNHPTCGPVALPLAPDRGTNTRGRDGFYIHGDNQAMNHTASHGCIILPRVVRQELAASNDRRLLVWP
jgi:hypothetical protein